MKISIQQYTQSLFDAVAGRTEKEVKAACRNFVALLGRNRELNKAEEIIRAFNDLWSREQGEVAAELTSARELGPTARKAVVNYLKEKASAKKIILEEKVDKKLIGGFILKYNNRILDGSLKSGLAGLKGKIGS
jgi:F-type H+-transporting ATPase subunit delta